MMNQVGMAGRLVRGARLLAPAVAALTLLGAAAASAADVTFEAESASAVTKPFTYAKGQGASGGICLMQPLLTGRPPKVRCYALYHVVIPATGHYHVWGRCLWQNGCGNSFNLRFDKSPAFILGQDGTYNRWHWVPVKGHTFYLSAGVHNMVLMNREDGPSVDEFYLTTDDDDVPAGALRQTAGVIVR